MTASVEEWKRRYETARLAHEEARAEIEKLRNNYSILKSDYDMARSALADAREDNDCLVSERIENEAEIERLREQVASLQASGGYEASIAQVELERLLAALHGIMEATDLDEVGVIARRALEPQP